MKLSRDLLFAAGRPFSPVYSWLMLARQELYRKGFFKQHRLPVPVISVGNLTMGGTGKTPTVAFIATFLQSLGYHPAIISRGYGGRAKEVVNLISDAEKVFLDARDAGDEPFMLARNLPGIPVLTGTKRLYPCFYALEKLHCDILILDDGFQHLSLIRDIDLVLFNATSLAGNSRVFPGGELREPASALRRSTAFLLTGVNTHNQERAARFTELLQERFPQKPVFSSRIAIGPLFECSGIAQKVPDTAPSPLHAFCGIAHPERFCATLEGAGFKLSGFTAFSDHWPYTQNDMDSLSRNAEINGAKGFVTTEKDLVKVETFTRSLPLFSVKTQLNPEESFSAFLKKNLPLPSGQIP
ncbi:MAG: tetraacyldisaccharide 4'-kinase [Desulfoprunum sp.]|nr:tetraacyldisaccharide 4'-kinase [Desulfoprunum sp.]